MKKVVFILALCLLCGSNNSHAESSQGRKALKGIISDSIDTEDLSTDEAEAALDRNQKALIAREKALLKRVKMLEAQAAAEQEEEMTRITRSKRVKKVMNEKKHTPTQKSPSSKRYSTSTPVKAYSSPRGATSDRVKSLELQVKSLEKQKLTLSRTIRVLESEKSDLKAKLARAKAKAKDAVTQLDEFQVKVLIAETEVERLSEMLDGDKDSGAIRFSPTEATHVSSNQRMKQPVKPALTGDKEMAVATVTATKLNLRTGPGLEHSPLMVVSQGTRLAVETRQGEWFQIIAPTGVRAWASESGLSINGQESLSTPLNSNTPVLAMDNASAKLQGRQQQGSLRNSNGAEKALSLIRELQRK